MKRIGHLVRTFAILLALCIPATVAPAQAFSTTTVEGTVYAAGGAPVSGSLQISWPAFTTAAGQAVAAGRTTVTIGADGFFSVNLAPNLGALPAGLYYTAVYHLADGTTSTEYWQVPAAAQASLSSVRATVMPAAQAVQAVSKSYVDQTISEALQGQITVFGGTLIGPLYLAGDPSQPLQAADKHYVDGAVAGALPLSGGALTGPVTGPQIGAVWQADQFAGSDFGASLQLCINNLNATSGGTCDARNFPGAVTMAANLTIQVPNTTIYLPCSTITTAASIIVPAGVRNVTLRGCATQGTSAASGSQGGTVIVYSGTAAAIEVGDSTYAANTQGFHLDNVVVNTTAATASTAQAIAVWRTQELSISGLYLLGNANQTAITLDGTGNYTGGTFQDLHISGFQTAINGIGHQATNPATTDWLNASTFVRVHIDCPTTSGNPIAGTTGINLAQGDGNTFLGGDVEGCGTALHLGSNAQNNTLVGLRNENSNYQVVADTGSAYNNWITGGTMFTGKLTDNGTRNSFLDTFHRSFNGLNGDWYGSQQDATVTNHFRLGTGAGNERGLYNRYQTDFGYRWTTGLSDATAGEQFYQILDELNNVYRLSIGQYNNGQASTNNQTVINAAGTGAVVFNGSTNAGTGGVVFGSGGPSSTTVATIDQQGNAQFTGTLQVSGTSQSTGTMTVRNNADAEVDYYLWPGLTASQKGSFTYKDFNGNSQWYMVKDQYNNWALNSAVGGLDSFKAYQSTNTGDTYINASNATGHIRLNYETGSGAETDIYAGGSTSLAAAISGPTAIKLPGLAAASGHNCLQIDSAGWVSNAGAPCGSGSGGSGTVNSGTSGQIAYYGANGTAVSGTNTVPLTAGGTGAATATAALASLGAVPLAGGTMTGALTATQFNGPLNGNVTGNVSGTAANVTGTVAVANGGTGATVASLALANLGAVPLAGGTMTGALTATQFNGPLNGNVAGNVTGNVTGNVSGTAANVTGVVAPANGGTGATTAAGALTNLGAVPLAGGTMTGALTATQFNGPLTGNVTGNVSGTAANVTGTVAPANGGTGATTAAGALANLGAMPAAGGTMNGALTVRNSADAEVDYFLWPGLTASQKGSFVYKDWNGNNQWYLVKDSSNNFAVNSAIGGLDSFKAYQSSNSGDTYINASNTTGHIRLNYETGSGVETDVYSNASLDAAFLGPTSIKLPGLAATSGHNCVQIDNSGYLTNTGIPCGGGSGTVNSGTSGQIAYYSASGTAVSGMTSIPLTAGGTGATTASAALTNLGAVPLAGGTMTGALTATQFNGPVTGNVTGNVSGTAANVTGVVALANGGTGATTAAGGLANLGAVPLAGGTMTGALTATQFNGPVTGNVTGNVSGTAANVTGTVAVANGGTGATTATAALASLGAVPLGGGTMTGALTATQFNGPLAGNVIGNLTGNVSGNVSGTAANVTGTVAVANGGTGATTAAGGLANLGAVPLAGGTMTGPLTATQFNGPLNGNVTGNVTGNVSGTAANVTGTVPLANGGTGATTATAALASLGGVALGGGTMTGALTATQFNGPLSGNVTGNVTGNLTGSVTGNVSGTAANVTGVVAPANGGTGATTAAGALANLLPGMTADGSNGMAVSGSAAIGGNLSASGTVAFPALAASAGTNCLQVDNAGHLTNSGAGCGTMTNVPAAGLTFADASVQTTSQQGALTGSANDGTARAAVTAETTRAEAAETTAQAAANAALPANGCASSAGGNVTCPGQGILGGGVDVQTAAVEEELPNNTASGATLYGVVVMNGSGQAQTATTGSVNWSGIAMGGGTGTTSGVTRIARLGQAVCTFDGSTTIGDFVQISPNVAGDCYDTGSTTYPTSGAVLGRVVSANAGAGTTAIVNLYGPGVQSAMGAMTGAANDGTARTAVTAETTRAEAAEAAIVAGQSVAGALPANGAVSIGTGAANTVSFPGTVSVGTNVLSQSAGICAPLMGQYNVKCYGAKGDVRTVANAAISASTPTTLTSASAAFTSADTGKKVSVAMGPEGIANLVYGSGLSATGGPGTCAVTGFNNGSGATATLYVGTGNAILGFQITNAGTNFTAPPTTASIGTCTTGLTVTGSLVLNATAPQGTSIAAQYVATTITYVSATTVTMGTAATTAGSGMTARIGTDDTAAAQAAYAAANGVSGATVYFPPGTYFVSTLTLSQSNPALASIGAGLEGAGETVTTLQQMSTSGCSGSTICPVININPALPGIFNASVTDMTINGASSYYVQGNDGIEDANVNAGQVLRNVEIANMGADGIHSPGNVNSFAWRDLYIHNLNWGWAIYDWKQTYKTAHGSMDNIRWVATQQGLYLNTVDNVTITNFSGGDDMFGTSWGPFEAIHLENCNVCEIDNPYVEWNYSSARVVFLGSNKNTVINGGTLTVNDPPVGGGTPQSHSTAQEVVRIEGGTFNTTANNLASYNNWQTGLNGTRIGGTCAANGNVGTAVVVDGNSAWDTEVKAYVSGNITTPVADTGMATQTEMVVTPPSGNGTYFVRTMNGTLNLNGGITPMVQVFSTNTAASGAQNSLVVQPTYNQAGGSTAANTDILDNRTETAVGSGAQLLMDLQVGGASRFKVDHNGVVTAQGQVMPSVSFIGWSQQAQAQGTTEYYSANGGNTGAGTSGNLTFQMLVPRTYTNLSCRTNNLLPASQSYTFTLQTASSPANLGTSPTPTLTCTVNAGSNACTSTTPGAVASGLYGQFQAVSSSGAGTMTWACGANVY